MLNSVSGPSEMNRRMFFELYHQDSEEKFLFLNGDPLDYKSIQLVGNGGSKRVYQYGNGDRVFILLNEHGTKAEEQSARLSRELGLLAIDYKIEKMSIKDPASSACYATNVLTATNFRTLSNLAIRDDNGHYLNKWTCERPCLYQKSLSRLSDLSWNTILFGDFIKEITVMFAFNLFINKKNPRLNTSDTLNQCIEKPVNDNVPPKLHYYLFDFGNDAWNLPPYVFLPTAKEIISFVKESGSLNPYVIDEESSAMGLSYFKYARAVESAFAITINEAPEILESVYAHIIKICKEKSIEILINDAAPADEIERNKKRLREFNESSQIGCSPENKRKRFG